MHEILPSLFRFQSRCEGPHHPVNSYLWRGSKGTILIDPAHDLTPGQISEPLSAIFITHLQAENAAGCLNFPDVPVFVAAGDEELCGGEAAYRALIQPWAEPWDWETRGDYHGHVAGAPNERPLPVGRNVCPLESSAMGFGPEVRSTPGHGKRAVTFVADISGQKVGFCGDLICGDGQLWNWFDSEWDYGLQTGQSTLLQSVNQLAREPFDWLFPTHGEPIENPQRALETLAARLEAILRPIPPSSGLPAALHDSPINIPDRDSAAPGFRRILPQLHQWRDGNCAVLLSQSGAALLIDDGLCYWQPLTERARHHAQVIESLKREFDIARIEWVIPTHYHGDHIENIPSLAASEGTRVLCLDIVADVLETPERFNLACPLPWYGTEFGRVAVDKRVADGAKFRWHEYELEIFHLGGQTYFHAGIAVEISGERVIFTGDAISGWNEDTDPVLCYNDAEPQTRGWAHALDRLAERQPDWLIGGHGVAIYHPQPLLDAKKRAWRQRLAQFQTLSFRPDLRAFFDPFWCSHDRR